ncbi:MAG: GNAT family N-acetyltransferase [Ilumatobacter sp.]|nr:GNAT family N-acetyltransferase [bacterium]MDG1264885.1 GNAT family N-acetyltransferase [Ilumatobacter sp.]
MRQATANPSARAVLRSWPLDVSICHLSLADVSMVPTSDQVDGWLAAAYAAPSPVVAVRTGALFPAAAAVFAERGFVVIDRLVLLERALHGNHLPKHQQHETADLRRARRRDLETMASIDQSAFRPGWRNDGVSLAAIANATPSFRSRLAYVRRPHSSVAGFAITGKAGSTGYLQRIAVHPKMQQLGIGRQLVDDALKWLIRRGTSRALVNTGVDNFSALAMYERASFERLGDELVILEHRQKP